MLYHNGIDHANGVNCVNGSTDPANYTDGATDFAYGIDGGDDVIAADHADSAGITQLVR